MNCIAEQAGNTGPLVSVIVPCYNSEPWLAEFLDSVELQSYGNLDLIFINDGSTDGTLQILESRRTALSARFGQVRVISQQNVGLGGAIARGLELAEGEFLTWSDPDDLMTPWSIEVRVEALLEHAALGLVSGNVESFLDGESPPCAERGQDSTVETIAAGTRTAEILTLNFTMGWASMIRASALDATERGRRIYWDSQSSQNVQLLAPVLEHFSSGFVVAITHFYRIRRGSRSRAVEGAEHEYHRSQQLFRVALYTARSLRDWEARSDAILRRYHVANRVAPRAVNAGRHWMTIGLLVDVGFSAWRSLLFVLISRLSPRAALALIWQRDAVDDLRGALKSSRARGEVA